MTVYDQKGGMVGKIESVSAKGAVVSDRQGARRIPVSSFGKNDKGLVISMTKAELDATPRRPRQDDRRKTK